MITTFKIFENKTKFKKGEYVIYSGNFTNFNGELGVVISFDRKDDVYTHLVDFKYMGRSLWLNYTNIKNATAEDIKKCELEKNIKKYNL